ncbi:MAG: succinate dehydrogenase cytochrome b subunit [Myxococcota bacterium]|nr:succinate dehydrogenase cytochrome b subunit [Myxococcota bacterium]
MATRALTLYDATIGKKAVMALSGLVMLGFVFGHMAGNLLIFKGPEAMNEYAKLLREVAGGAGLWIARAALLAAIGAHVWSAVSLRNQNKAARPVEYRRTVSKRSTAASRTMWFGGLTILLYIIYHIAHLTFGATVPGGYHPTNVYQNVVASFQVWWIVAVYVVAQVALGMHLYHGAWSFMQTLGISHPRFNHLRNKFAVGFATITCLGFAVVPLAVMFGIVK